MIFISKIEFKNVTVTYDEEKVNKELCKKKRKLMDICTIISPLILLILMFFGFLLLFKFYSFPLIFIISMLITGCISGFFHFTDWIIYHKVSESFFFVERMFKVNDIHAGWFNNKILIREQHPYRIDDYGLKGFVNDIENELVINDKSDKSKPIHIYIDVTNDEKTEILVKNVEEKDE